MKTFGKRPSSCPRLRPKGSYAKLVEDRDQKQKALAKSAQQVGQRDIDDIFASIQHIDEQNVDGGVEKDALAAEIRKYEAEGWIAPPENNDSDIDDYYDDYAESESGDEEDEEDEGDEGDEDVEKYKEEVDQPEHREIIERSDAERESGDGKDVEEGDPHQRHEVFERVNEVPLVSRTYTKDDEEVTLTLTLT